MQLLKDWMSSISQEWEWKESVFAALKMHEQYWIVFIFCLNHVRVKYEQMQGVMSTAYYVCGIIHLM